jgi:uncharacterized membrane protein
MLWNNEKVFALVLLVKMFCIPCHALAYFGPGAGVTMFGAFWAVIAAIVLTLIGIILYPLRKLIKRLKNKSTGAEKVDATAVHSETNNQTK